jgi:hypothetical protein
VPFSANDAIDLTKIATENMAEEEEKRIKGLILRGGRGAMLDSQRGEESPNSLVTEFGGWLAADEGLKASDPKAIGLEGLWRVIAQLDGAFEVSVFLLPGCCMPCG